jgi:carbamoyl-phosphate synthase small subunit
MVGYPEALTDPSYRGQILVFTYPLIGNYGVPLEKYESDKIQVSGVIIDNSAKNPSDSASKTFDKWLMENNVPGLCNIDTRDLTLKIRSRGVMKGKLFFRSIDKSREFIDIDKINLVSEVSKNTIKNYGVKKGARIALIDCGVKFSIIRALVNLGARVTRVPWDWDYNNFDNFDGVFISNGPGDPKLVTKTIKTINTLLKSKIPIMGVCLGSQILALAAGGDTYKLPFGHRSHNQPVLEISTGKAYLTTQNHGYAVDMESLGSGWEEWFVNLNDKTNEGIKHKTKPFRAVQFHPEGNPGPQDTNFIFNDFIKLCEKYSS